jgi:hypothetical protein
MACRNRCRAAHLLFFATKRVYLYRHEIATKRAMKSNSLFITLLLATCCGCTLSKRLQFDVEGLQRVAFEPFRLEPEEELLDFRIDIIRQTSSESVTDSTSEYRDVAYHKLGFNLGNGLYYDLNDNLSLRLDDLLGLDVTNDFKLERSLPERSKRKKVYTQINGALMVEYPSRSRKYPSYNIFRYEDSLSVFLRNRFCFSITRNDSTLTERFSDRVYSTIRKEGDGLYRQSLRKHSREFKQADNELVLAGRYRIVRSEDAREIRIYRIGKKADVLQYRMIRDERSIIVFNENYHKMKIEMDSGRLVLTSGFGGQEVFSSVP